MLSFAPFLRPYSYKTAFTNTKFSGPKILISFSAIIYSRTSNMRRAGAKPGICNGGGCFGGMGAEQLPEAGGKAPSRRRHRGLEAETPALKNFAFF